MRSPGGPDEEGIFMGRYIRDVELRLPVKEVEDEIRAFLKQENFYLTIWKDRGCWCADMPGANDYLGKNLKKVYFFEYSYAYEVLHLEAWVRDGKKGESDMSGIGAYAQRQAYLDKLILLENNLIEKLPKDGELYARNKASILEVRKKSNKTIKIGNMIVTACVVFLAVMYFLFV